MNSPYSGSPMTIKTYDIRLNYKGKSYTIHYECWVDDNGNEFTDEEQETDHMNQLYTQVGELDKVDIRGNTLQ